MDYWFNVEEHGHVIDLLHLPIGRTERFFRQAVDSAKAGKKVLWVCAEESQTMWVKRFVDAGCATYREKQGVAVGPPDPTI